MKGSSVLLLGLSIALTSGCGEQSSDTSEEIHPNIIIIVTDDQGWGDLSLHGNENLNTPNLDSLALSGVQFRNFYVQPVCSPTRAELLTGRYARRLGVYDTSSGGERMRLGETTIGEAFRKAGYSTALFGKWHNGTQPPYHPLARGFDTFYGFTSGHWGSYFNPVLDFDGRLVRGEGYLPDDLTQKAIDFIGKKQKDPFLVMLAYNTPHSPMQVPDSEWENVKTRPVTQLYHDPSLEDVAFTRAALAMVENIDKNVGRIGRALDSLNIGRKTIVVFMSDNGPNSYRYNGPWKGRKGSTDEGGVKSPLFISWAGELNAGAIIEEVSAAIDLLPTLAGLAGVSLQSANPLDGKDLGPLLRDTETNWQDRLLFQHWNGRTAVRTQAYRLDAEENLYEMGKDPGQTKDMGDLNPAIRDSLIREKELWLESLPEIGKIIEPFPVGARGFDFTHLPARDAEASGKILRSNQYPNDSYFTNWIDLDDQIEWNVEVLETGTYEATIYYTCAQDCLGSILELELNSNSVQKEVSFAHDPPLIGEENDRYPRMESYTKDFAGLTMGRIQLNQGAGILRLRGLKKTGQSMPDIRLLALKKIE